ncbi:High-affinity nicotinic acid transporter [Sesbania bispinosa]|nr:High-affinity nicotinic acid transporter [Sesbania bispinosa]
MWKGKERKNREKRGRPPLQPLPRLGGEDGREEATIMVACARGQGAWTVARTARGEKKGFASAACERWRCRRTEGDNSAEGECLTVVRGVWRTCWWWTIIGRGWTRVARAEERGRTACQWLRDYGG